METSWSRPTIPETAGLGARFVAFTIDFLLASGIFIVLAGALLGAAGVAEVLRFDVDVDVVLLPLVLLWAPTLLVYLTITEGLFGRTVGKDLLGLRTVRTTGEDVGLFDSFIRNVLRFLWFFFFPVGLVFLFADLYLIRSGELDQRIGDLGAETIVVRS